MSKEMHVLKINCNQFQRTPFPHARGIVYITVMKIGCVHIQAEFLAGDSKIDPCALPSQWDAIITFLVLAKIPTC